ncbi:MAG: hypothetical protein ABSG53_03730 [Thermoguttaceae bacterium]
MKTVPDTFFRPIASRKLARRWSWGWRFIDDYDSVHLFGNKLWQSV